MRRPDPGSLTAPLGTLRMPAAAALATALSAICLGDVFLTGGWFLPVVFAVLFAGVGNELARRLTVPRILVPFVGLLVLSCYLVGRYARDEALLWILPDPSALDRLAALARQGNDDVARFAAPISVGTGVELLAVAGVGLVALAVDALAVSMRRAALAGLPLLALYTVPASVAPNGVSWEAFALGGAGFLTLLLTEARERFSRWGRPLRFAPAASPTDWHGSVQTGPLAQVGRRVGAAALGLALVVPAVLPDLNASSFGLGSGFGPGNGSGNKVAVVNPIIDLGKDLRRGKNRPVIRYEGPRTYLRMVALDVFTGDTWRPSELKVPKDQNVSQGLPATQGVDSAVERNRHRYTIEILGLEDQWLPLPYPSERVQIDGRWVYDTSTFNVFSVNSSTRGLTYKATQVRVTPTPAQLRAATPPPSSIHRYLSLPLGIPAVVKRVAEQITAYAPTDYDKAMALQSWLRDPAEFTYDTHVSDGAGDANGGRAVAAFLDTRRGYCVHFASTMAVMARQLGIPARVAVGFTPGSRDAQGRYVVGLHDLHAWPELYFGGAGWMAFEPTPGGRTGDPPPWANPNAAAAGGPDASPTPEPSSTESGAPAAAPKDLSGDVSGLQGKSANQSLWQRYNLPLVPTVLLVVLLLLSLVPFTTRLVVRRLRWRRATTPAGIVVTAWAELRDTLLDHGYTWHPSDSPRRAAVRASEELALPEEAEQAVRRLATATERARYATAPGEVGDLRSDVGTVRAALAAQAGRWGRIRARWLPRSTRTVAVAFSERFADALDAMDIAAARVKDRVFSGRSRPDAGSSAPPAVP
jgi:transglutaminase-like putative cysteine protease